MNLILHNFFRSSTSYRVRAALNLKGLSYDYAAYALRKGETRTADYLSLNPQGLVPTLEVNGQPLTQSLAILEWLDETHPTPPLLPTDALDRARVRALAHTIALDIHPLNNLRVLFCIRDVFNASEADQADWFRHWVAQGFTALETQLARDPQTG
ncbi:MAG: maleylacetoacetate isomerase, partial [Pseudomonadota bacterium]